MTGQETRVTKFSKIADKASETEACLVVIYATDKSWLGKKFPLTVDEITIGRDASNSIVLDSDNVSRRHCRVWWQKGALMAADQGSTNGTYLNDARVTAAAEIGAGDIVRVGKTTLELRR